MFSKKKLRSKGLWVALFSLIAMIANDAFNIAPEEVEKYTDIALTILIAGGIINNPEKQKEDQ